MKFLRLVSASLSKLKTNSVLSSMKKLHYMRHKSIFLQEKYFSRLVLASCFTTVKNRPSQPEIIVPKTGKQFQETENEYAHEVMEKLPDYVNSLSIHPLQLDKYILRGDLSIETCNAIEKFIETTLNNLSEGSCLSSNKFTNIVQNVCSVLPQASDEEIKRILHYLCMWPPTPSTMTKNFNVLWNALDKECVKRLKRWDINHQLLVSDYWFHLRLSRIGQYNQEVIYSLLHNIDLLLNHQVVQLMFYINLQRKIPFLLISNLEKKLEKVINNLTLEEIGIICLGFFKTKSKLSDSLLIESIIKKFMHDVEITNTVTVAAILKFLRKSLNRSLIDLYILFLHKCINYVNNWDIPTSVHLALLSSECNVFHPLLLNCVSQKLSSNIENARIKDCTKLLLCLSMFNHCEGKFNKLFISELLNEERQNEFHSYPVHVVHAAIYYAYMGIFNYELLTKIFDKQFFSKTSLNFPGICSVFAELDCCVEIECQDYAGPKLDVSVRKVLSNHRGNLFSKSEKPNMQTRLLSDVYESLVEILGNEKNFLIRHILPHFYSPDIIVRFSEFQSDSLADLFGNYPSDEILKPPSNEMWASFVITGVYSFAYKSTQMTGITSMKLRQLKKIGYKVVFIPYFQVSQNKSHRKKFLEEKLNELENRK